MEPRGSDPDFVRQTMQLAAVWEDFLRLKPHMKVVLPQDLVRLKQRLGALHQADASRRAADYDLFYGIGVVLARGTEPLTMSELSAALAVPLSTATRMVDWLVESGYAERLSDPTDRRVVLVGLTEAGREVYAAINTFMRERVRRLLEAFSTEERQELIRLLRKLADTLAEMAS